MKKKNGFTIIELLVAMSVLAIVISIGAMSLTGSLVAGRNGKRRSDLKAIQNAMEQYYSVIGSYPTTDLSALSPAYLKNGVPTDTYYPSSYNLVTLTTNSYNICADLEKVGTNDNGTDNDLCVSNEQ